MKINSEVLEQLYSMFRKEQGEFKKMSDYYENKSDAMKDYKMITERSSLKTNTNFIKLFIDKEVSYSLGNNVTYSSRSGNEEFINEVVKRLTNLEETHDINLLESMLIHSIAYELYYIDRNGEFAAKVIPATSGYALLDEYGDIEVFLHVFERTFQPGVFIDVYTDDLIYHYRFSREGREKKWEEIAEPNKHIFGKVPVGIATWDKEKDQKHKTIYAVSKGLQDAYETNMSDLSNEISDFRNAYLTLIGAEIDDDDVILMKKNGVIQAPNGAKIEWLMKDLQGRFIHDTLENIEDKLYQMNGHINQNEMHSGNESARAIDAKNMTLKSKSGLNQKAIAECIKTRLSMLVKAMEVIGVNKNYDARDVYPVFVANLPADDLSTAEVIAKLGDRISTQTALEQLSFVKDPQAELERIQKEQLDRFGESYFDDFQE